MIKILPLYFISLIFAILSHRSSYFNGKLGRYVSKDRIFYAVVIIAAVVFAGLRTDYNDTSTYIMGYNNLDVSTGLFSGIDWSIGENPLFSLTNAILRKAGFSSQSFIMTYSALTMGISLWFIWKYTNDIPLSVLLFFTTGCFGFSMAAMKQCVATAFCLIGIDRLLRGRTILFFFWVAIGTLFHPFAVGFFVCPFLTFSPWTAPTYLMIALCAVAGYTMQRWLGSAISFLSIVGIDYDVSQLDSEGVNIFRVLVVWAPVVLSFIAAKFWTSSRNKADNLLMNLSVLCAELMFIALFGNPVYMGRLANFFLIFQAISIPIVLNHYEINSKIVLKIATVIGYIGYTVYGNLLNGYLFDAVFHRTTLWKYLGEIF